MRSVSMVRADFVRSFLKIHLALLAAAVPMASWAADVIVAPQPYAKAFKNPLKGFEGGTEYCNVRTQYIPWNTLERSAADGVDRIKKWSDSAWASLPAQNIKIIPRVWGEYPGRPNAWPSDLTVNYSSASFINRMKNLIAKMGLAWDKDPRVAFMNTCLVGPWGEQAQFEQGGSYFNAPIMTAMCEGYRDAFPYKLFNFRHATTCNSQYGVFHWSWGCTGQSGWYTAWVNNGLTWKTNVFEGEISYDWCPPVHASPTEDVADTVGMAKLCEIARMYHSTGCAWISGYAVGPSTARGAEMFQMTNGYRLVIDTVRYSGQVSTGGTLSVSFGVTNIGAAQFLYPWPVEVSLCDPSTKQPAWTDTFANLDVRKWLPGDKWDMDLATNNYKTHKYLVQPIKYTASGAFVIPASLAAKEYVLALAILDPLGGRLPCARFAIVNYWNGGRHPIGKVGVGVAVANPQLDPATFNDLKADASLHYIYNPNPTVIGGTGSAAFPARSGVVVHRSGARTVAITLSWTGRYEMQIAGINGRTAMKASGIAAYDGQTIQLSVPAAPGMYVLNVKTPCGNSVQRIEVAR